MTHNINIQTSMDEFKKIAMDLMINQGFTHAQLKRALREEILEKSKDIPPVNVLYCTTYGGYSFSRIFTDFVKQQQTDISDNDNERIHFCKYIPSFGAHCGQQFPLIARLVRAYKRNHLGIVSSHVYDIILDRVSSRQLGRLKDTITEPATTAEDGILDLDNECINYIRYGYKYNHKAAIDILSKYKKTALLNKLDELLNAYIDKEHEHIETCLALLNPTSGDPLGIVEDMIATYTLMTIDDDANSPHPPSCLDFATAVTKHNTTDTYMDGMVWKWHQRQFEHKAMRYLLIEDEDMIHNLEKLDAGTCADNMDQDMGLLFASTALCTLGIAQVPPWVSWRIEEYDGIEDVVY